MMTYYLKTEQGMTYMYTGKVGSGSIAGMAYSDFSTAGLHDDGREDILNRHKRRIGRILLYEDGNIVSACSMFGRVCAVRNDFTYYEGNRKIPYRRITLDDIAGEQKDKLSKEGFTHAYLLDKRSALDSVYCFEKHGEIGATITSRSDWLWRSDMLKGIALGIATRVMKLEYVIEFLRKVDRGRHALSTSSALDEC